MGAAIDRQIHPDFVGPELDIEQRGVGDRKGAGDIGFSVEPIVDERELFGRDPASVSLYRLRGLMLRNITLGREHTAETLAVDVTRAEVQRLDGVISRAFVRRQ